MTACSLFLQVHCDQGAQAAPRRADGVLLLAHGLDGWSRSPSKEGTRTETNAAVEGGVILLCGFSRAGNCLQGAD